MQEQRVAFTGTPIIKLEDLNIVCLLRCCSATQNHGEGNSKLTVRKKCCFGSGDLVCDERNVAGESPNLDSSCPRPAQRSMCTFLAFVGPIYLTLGPWGRFSVVYLALCFHVVKGRLFAGYS